MPIVRFQVRLRLAAAGLGVRQQMLPTWPERLYGQSRGFN
jgi:hypothetical protein